MQTAFYALTLAIATYLWGYFFYKKDYHPQSFRITLQIFGVGLFSMLPIFGYRWLYEHYLPRLAEYEIFRPLLTHPLLIGLGYFIFNLAALYLVLFVLSGALTLTLTLFQSETLRNIKRTMREESLDFIGVSIMIGALIYLETLVQEFTGLKIVQTALGAILFLAVIEEYIKHLVVRMTDDKKIKDIDDAITMSVMVGLAFAFIETIIYAIASGEWSLVVYRIFLSLPVHMIASGIFGYYYGLAHFAKPIVALEGKETLHQGWLPKILKCRRETLYAEGRMTEGLFFATLFHVIANVLFEISLAFLVVPFVVLGLMIINHLYRAGQIEWKLIRRRIS